MQDTTGNMVNKRVWDLPTRLFHWLLLCAISGAVVTQYLGGMAMTWHFRFGYMTLALILFRVIWGLIGTRHARFASFVRGPSAILAHLKGRKSQGANYPGHNPLGALSVLAMMGAILFQTGTGLFANDDIAEQGPLAKFIDKDLSDQISTLHSQVGITLIGVLVTLHVAAIAYYLLRQRVNLVKPMICGDKPDCHADEAIRDGWAERARALACLAFSAGLVWYLAHL